MIRLLQFSVATRLIMYRSDTSYFPNLHCLNCTSQIWPNYKLSFIYNHLPKLPSVTIQPLVLKKGKSFEINCSWTPITYKSNDSWDILKDLYFAMWVWMVRTHNILCNADTLHSPSCWKTVEFPWTIPGRCSLQYFSINKKRHLKVCPPLLGVHRNSKYPWVFDAVMQSLAFCVVGNILISPIPFLPSSTYIVLKQPYTLLQIPQMAVLAICFLWKK